MQAARPEQLPLQPACETVSFPPVVSLVVRRNSSGFRNDRFFFVFLSSGKVLSYRPRSFGRLIIPAKLDLSLTSIS